MSDDYPQLSVRVEDDVYTLDLGACTALDASACRRATGMSLQSLLSAAATDPDLDVVAAAIWLARRQDGEPTVSFEEVASELSYLDDWDYIDTDLTCVCGFEAKSQSGLANHRRSCEESGAPGEGQDGS